ncbi:Collagen alpha-1(IX) chain [Lonchura striata]|uniref:Collagen alpha-1(IX) chain n=1 Tax=Lonchura striata TaxID=40157 RepID=A0A218UPF8_9PASE|nr:Collagen alpha-1(IX) chain [Lonchura striata domestica]
MGTIGCHNGNICMGKKITAFFYLCSFLWSFISATIQHQSSFDLISQFQIEKAASQGIIERVVGSTSLQVAYKLGPNVDFRIPTSAIYSNGLPDEYSFLTTFRMTGATLQKYWTIWQIQDSSGKEQVGVNLNGQMKSVEFSYKGADGRHQTASFLHLPFLFDSQWHKLMIIVEANSVTLFIDCIKIESLNIKPKGKINTDGFAVLGKLKNNPQISVPFEIQWMVIHCDPLRPQREGCGELPARVTQTGIEVSVRERTELGVLVQRDEGCSAVPWRTPAEGACPVSPQQLRVTLRMRTERRAVVPARLPGGHRTGSRKCFELYLHYLTAYDLQEFEFGCRYMKELMGLMLCSRLEGREAQRAPLVHRVQMGMQANQDPLGYLESRELMGSQDSQVLVDFQARGFLDHLVQLVQQDFLGKWVLLVHLEIREKEGPQGYQDLQVLQGKKVQKESLVNQENKVIRELVVLMVILVPKVFLVHLVYQELMAVKGSLACLELKVNRAQREKQVQQAPGEHQVPRGVLDFLDCLVLQAFLVVKVTGVRWVNQDLRVNRVHLEQKEMVEKRVT